MSSRKLKLIAVVSAIVIMGSVFMMGETPLKPIPYTPIDQHSSADIVFAYDFDDGNLSDWSWFAIDDGIPYNEYPGNVTVVNGVMKHGPDHWNIALVNSSVAYGTWSFDVFVEDQPIDHEIVIPFILIEYVTEVYLKQAYIFQIVTGHYPNFLIPGTNLDQPRLQAGKIVLADSPTGRSITWTDQYNTDDIWGWKNFIITRENNGQFYVYMNGSLVLGYKDNQHTTCNHFAFSSRIAAFDNLMVNDSVDYDAAPPEWNPAPTNQFIVIGDDFRYDINASDYSGVDTATWAVNDTTNYAIDSDGVIINIVDLAVGTYGLNVSVSDTGGYTRSATFTVTVESAAPPPFQPGVLTYVMLGGGVFLIALVVILVKNRR